MKLDDINPAEKPVYDEEAKAFIESCTHFIVFTEDRDDGEYFYHAVGYQVPPTEEIVKHVCEEVRDDPEFGLGEKIHDLNVSVMSGEGAEKVKEYLRGEGTPH